MNPLDYIALALIEDIREFVKDLPPGTPYTTVGGDIATRYIIDETENGVVQDNYWEVFTFEEVNTCGLHFKAPEGYLIIRPGTVSDRAWLPIKKIPKYYLHPHITTPDMRTIMSVTTADLLKGLSGCVEIRSLARDIRMYDIPNVGTFKVSFGDFVIDNCWTLKGLKGHVFVECEGPLKGPIPFSFKTINIHSYKENIEQCPIFVNAMCEMFSIDETKGILHILGVPIIPSEGKSPGWYLRDVFYFLEQSSALDVLRFYYVVRTSRSFCFGDDPRASKRTHSNISFENLMSRMTNNTDWKQSYEDINARYRIQEQVLKSIDGGNQGQGYSEFEKATGIVFQVKASPYTAWVSIAKDVFESTGETRAKIIKHIGKDVAAQFAILDAYKKGVTNG